MEAFLDRIRLLPAHRPRNSGGGSYRYRQQPTIYDDLFPLDDDFDLYVVWNAEDPGKGIRSVEVLGFCDLRPKIKPEWFEALRALNRSPTAKDPASFDPVLLVRAANALLELGPDEKAALKAYWDLARGLSFEEGRKRALDAFRILPVLQLHSADPSPFERGDGRIVDPGRAAWPLYPMVLEQDLPFLVALGDRRIETPEELSGRLGGTLALRHAPLAPTANPVEAVETLTASPRWQALATAQHPRDTVELKRGIRRQALEAIAPVYHPPDDYAPKTCCEDPSDAAWREVVEQVRALNLHWDPQAQDFIRSR
ncbi:MAG TPA: hypothetical protein VKW04_24225 [Planctomycetota bacterium]|nr:hypothetical protein [Planctomycetota bacterium]